MQVPLINGNIYSKASVTLKADGNEILGFREINYSDGLEPGEVRASDVHVIARTRGEYKAEGSMTLLHEAVDDLISLWGDGWMEKEFDILVSYEEGTRTSDALLRSCRVKKVDNSIAQGTDGLEVPLELSIMYIIRNGKKPTRTLRTG